MRKLSLAAALAAALALCLLTVSQAHAQPGYPPPPPPPAGGGQGYQPGPPVGAPGAPGFFQRRGLTIGFGVGVGGMTAESGPIECIGCDYEPIAGGFDFHIGGMLNPRLALLFEIWGTGQAVDAGGTTILLQTFGMVAIQYWVTPQLWLKGGLGGAQLSYSYDTEYESDSQEIDTGGAIMGAVGYEVMSGRRFAMDIQLRLGSGSYDGINEQINAGTIGVGFNWF